MIKPLPIGKTRSLLALGLGLLLAGACQGQEVASPAAPSFLTIHGFGTLGMAKSSSDNAEYVRDLSQPHGLTTQWSGKTDTVLGIQANLALGPQTEGVVQAISRYRYNGNHDPEISWAFVKHDFSPDFQARIGRLGTEFYMLADSRLIGYSNLTVRPPPDFFVPLVFSNFDGADLSVGSKIPGGLLRAKLFYGRSPETSPFFGDITWNLKGSRLYGGHVDYFSGPWQFRLGHSVVRFSSTELPLNALAASFLAPFPAPDITGMFPELGTAGKTAAFSSAGLIYDDGPLRLQAMYGRIDHESKAYHDSWSAFAVASYRLGEFTPYLGYSTVKSAGQPLSSPVPPPLAPLISALLTIPHMDRHTVTLGSRWDFYENIALKAQLDLVRGSPQSLMPFRGDQMEWTGRMQVISVTLDFAF